MIESFRNLRIRTIKLLRWLPLILATACISSTELPEMPEAPMTLYQIKAHPNTLTNLKGDIMVLGSGQILGWNLPAPLCMLCDLDIDVRFHPLGPETTVTLRSEKQKITILDTKLNRIFFGGQQIIIDNNQLIMLNVDGTNISLNKNKMLNLNDSCNIYVRWFEVLRNNTNPNYANDRPDAHTQLIETCTNN